MIVLNLLSIAYNSLTIAIKDISPNRDWTIYIGQGINAIFLLSIPITLFGLGSMAYSFYTQWEPHIGERILKDDFSLELTKIEAMDHLEPYGCNNLDVGMGWKFIILNYNIYATNKTKPISMFAGNLVDENGISYSNYYNDCLSGDEYYSRQEIPNISWGKSGKLVYRIPLNAVPEKISLSINTTWEPVEISLHKRQLL